MVHRFIQFLNLPERYTYALISPAIFYQSAMKKLKIISSYVTVKKVEKLQITISKFSQMIKNLEFSNDANFAIFGKLGIYTPKEFL